MLYTNQDYERLSESLETSGKILYAIEKVTGDVFERNDEGELAENLAFDLWNDGGKEAEILAALPTEDGGSAIVEGDEIFWGWGSKFAEFAGEKWIKA